MRTHDAGSPDTDGASRMRMHWTLQPMKSAALAVAFAAVAALVTPWAPLRPALLPVVGALCGVIVGVLQARGIRSTPEAFRSARTAMEVRRALVATPPGKWATRAHWVTTVLLLLVALTGTGIGWFVAFIAGNLSYMAVRDFTALPTLRHLASGSDSPATEPR